jgi:hypothetical protein
MSVGDYSIYNNEDGTGTDYSGSVTITTTFGANSAEFVVVNNTASADLYATKFQCRGFGIYAYDPVLISASNALPTYPGGGGQSANSKIQELFLDAKYRDETENTQLIANYLLDKINNAPKVKFKTVTFYANSSADLMDAFLRADIGSYVKITEDMAGANASDYFINGISFEISAVNIIRCTWYLMWDVEPAGAYWILGVAGRSELGTTANPAP